MPLSPIFSPMRFSFLFSQTSSSSNSLRGETSLGGPNEELEAPGRVFRTVSPWKKVKKFDRKGKLSPKFIGPYEVVEEDSDIFHVSMLRRYRSDPTHVMPMEEIELYPDLSYEEEPVEILTLDSKRFDDVWGFRLGLISQSKLESKWLWFLPYVSA
ncbi:hypothetical protein GQ457_11G022090 [Hibiscus cannabinus]